MDISDIENVVEYVQQLRQKYGLPAEPNGTPASVLDGEHLLPLLVRLEQSNEELRIDRDEYRHNLIGMLKEKFTEEPLPPLPPEDAAQDTEELLRELEEQPHD
jgi:hypothetical protein